jgi:CO dehydrogenase/acetyl-CoA synthase delta subunit
MWPRQKLERLGEDGVTIFLNHCRPLIYETQKENVENVEHLTEKVLKPMI